MRKVRIPYNFDSAKIRLAVIERFQQEGKPTDSDCVDAEVERLLAAGERAKRATPEEELQAFRRLAVDASVNG